MLKLEPSRTIAVEITPSLSSLDQSLSVIQHFLTERLAQTGLMKNGEILDELVIDIESLGIQKETQCQQKSWGDRAVYPIRIYHSTVLMGPLYQAKKGPCPHCLYSRWLSNRSLEEQISLDTLLKAHIYGINQKLLPGALDTIFTVVQSSLSQATGGPAYQNGEACFYELRLDSLHLSKNHLLANSHCSFCAHPEPDRPEAAVIQLQSRKKKAIWNYRIVSASDFTLPEKAYINATCGMLGVDKVIDRSHTVTAPVTGKWGSRTPAVPDKPDLPPRSGEVWWGGHHTSFAKSQRVGLLEALERYSSHWPRMRQTVVVDSYENLASDALDPRACGVYPVATYSDKRFEAFTPTMKMPWVWGYSFQKQRPILVPEILAFFASRNDGNPAFVSDTSNGCAIGSCIEEALLSALMELVERDGFLMSWYTRIAPPRIDPWTSRNRETLHLLDRVERMGFDTYFLDTRFDLPFPSVSAVAVHREDRLGKLAVAAAANLNPEEAIRSALCELAAYLSNMGERMSQKLTEITEKAQDHTKVSNLEDHPLIYGLPEMASQAMFLLQNSQFRSVQETYHQWNKEKPVFEDLKDDIEYCIYQILGCGMDVIALDLTAPELEGTNLKVVKAIVPGLIPIDFGWGRNRISGLSRLRTVPHTTGFMSVDFDLTHINVTPHPFP